MLWPQSYPASGTVPSWLCDGQLPMLKGPGLWADNAG